MEGDDIQHITHSGLVARSPQGHAAKSMPIKGNEDIWVEIQAHTFRNWVNDMLKETGYQVLDLTTDFCDGVRLVALIEVLQKRKLRKISRPANQHQMLENTTNALNAISADGIKLVNIGTVFSHKITSNLKTTTMNGCVVFHLHASLFTFTCYLICICRTRLQKMVFFSFVSHLRSALALSNILLSQVRSRSNKTIFFITFLSTICITFFCLFFIRRSFSGNC